MEMLELELAPSRRAVADARGAVTRRFEHLPRLALEDLRLLITELVANAIVHGDHSAGDLIRVRVIGRGGTVHAEVIDPGREGDVRPKPLDLEAPGGFGLHLVDEISDRWGVRHEGATCVWFELTPAGTAA